MVVLSLTIGACTWEKNSQKSSSELKDDHPVTSTQTLPPTSGFILARSGDVLALLKYKLDKYDHGNYKLVLSKVSGLGGDQPLVCGGESQTVEPKFYDSDFFPSGNDEENKFTLHFDNMKSKFYLKSVNTCDNVSCELRADDGVSVTIHNGKISELKFSGLGVLEATSDANPEDRYLAGACEQFGLKSISNAEFGKYSPDLDLSQPPQDYGNWCGANNTREDRNYPVRDGVDAVCRDHDLCIRDNGYHKCSCDGAFIRHMGSASSSDPRGEAYRVAALAIFQVKPCECRVKICYPRCNGLRCRPSCDRYVSKPGLRGACR